MRPITDTLPKPLIEVRGKPLISWHLERLAAAGIRDIVINVAHLGSMIESALGDGRRWGVSIAWSRESVALETAGGIAQALDLLGSEPFLVVNADVYCEIAFTGLRQTGLTPRLGHLVLVPNPAFRPEGDFSLVDGRVGNLTAPRYTYSGIGVLAPSMMDGVIRGSKAPLAPLLRCAADASLLSGELFSGLWSDVGTPGRLADLNHLKAS